MKIGKSPNASSAMQKRMLLIKKTKESCWAEGIIVAVQDAMLNRCQWYEEQIEIEQQNTRAVEVRLNNEMGRLEALHDKESKLWQEVKAHYEENASSGANKILHLKKALKEM